MSFQPGTRIGPYEITTPLGAGGMGVVYRARDAKLNREVALKVLPEAFATDEGRLARFTREAQTLAALNHPNIAAIYGIEESTVSEDKGAEHPVQALVMELVEGEDLSERIARGALPVEDALEIGHQIIDALEAAHQIGIIHRDLKPANIKVREDGTVKVLDFGLAKATQPSFGEASEGKTDVANSPTLTMQATQAGLILGTAAYMAPEQAKGKPVDTRADTWAFGVVLFEALTGKRVFQGEDVSETLAAVLRAEPDWELLPTNLPGPLRKLLERCLSRDPRRRLRDIGEARIIIEDLLAAGPVKTTGGEVPSPTTRRRMLPWAIATLASVAAGLAVWRPWIEPPPAEITRLKMNLPLDLSAAELSMAFSPDGRTIAYVPADRRGIYLQHLDQPDIVFLAGTAGATAPFFSPDGQWIGYSVRSDSLKKVSLRGGAPQSLAPLTISPHGGAWTEDGTIIFSGAESGLFRVSDKGGNPEALSTLEADEYGHRWPSVLPGGKHVLMTRRTQGAFEDTRIEAVSLVDGRRQILVEEGAYHGRYAPSGHLVFMRENTLFALPFDPEALNVLGSAVPVVQGVRGSLDNLGVGQYAFSPQGDLIYLSDADGVAATQLIWIDRQGKKTALSDHLDSYHSLKLSPDGKRLALEIAEGGQRDIWIENLEQGTRIRLTFDPNDDDDPIWSPDGKFILFASDRAQAAGELGQKLFRKRSDAAGEAERIDLPGRSLTPGSISPDGDYLVYEGRVAANVDILSWRLDDNSPGEFEASPPSRENRPMISPDGRWVAYGSTGGGRDSLFIQPFPRGSGKWQIDLEFSPNQQYAVWSAQSNELFFFNQGTMYVVAYQADGQSFQMGRPEPLFSLYAPGAPEESALPQGTYFDVTPDGQRFVMIYPVSAGQQSSNLVLVQNWFEDLKRLAPQP